MSDGLFWPYVHCAVARQESWNVASDGSAVQDLCAMLVLGELELLTFVNQPCCDYNRISRE